MKKCWIQIELDDNKSSHAPGELITGTIVVKVLEQCRCEQLTLCCQRRARGGGVGDEIRSEPLLTVTVREEWLAGQELRYAFRLEAPGQPLTYHGHLVSVDWFLRAEAHVSWFLEPPHWAEEPFQLVPAETQPSAPAATGPGPDSCHTLEMEAPPSTSLGCLFSLGFFALFFLSVPLIERFPPLIPIAALSGVLLHQLWQRKPAWNRAMGRLWLDSAAVTPGGSTGLRVQLRPHKRLREHDLSVSLECVELVTRRDKEEETTLQEKAVYTAPLLTCTNRPLSAGELLELPSVSLAIPSGAPTSFKLENRELRWRLRLELKRKGDRRTFFQLVPFKVHPPPPRSRTDAPRYQALRVSGSLPTEPAPWLQTPPPREKPRRTPRASEDIRRQLEGGLEVLEAAHAHYTTLEKALQEPRWKLNLRLRLDMLREARRQEPALEEALERLHHRARSEGWAGTEAALALAYEVEGLRGRLVTLASSQLGPPEDPEAPVTRWLERLEGCVAQSLPAPLAPGEKLLCSGRFSPSLSMPGLLLLVAFSFAYGGHSVGSHGEGETHGSGGWWGILLFFTALCFWNQYLRSGRFWLTESRLIWLPTRGDPLQVSLHDIRRANGSGFRYPKSGYPKSVKVEMADGQILQLAYVSRARLLTSQLRSQLQFAPSREHPRDSAPPEPPASAPG